MVILHYACTTDMYKRQDHKFLTIKDMFVNKKVLLVLSFKTGLCFFFGLKVRRITAFTWISLKTAFCFVKCAWKYKHNVRPDIHYVWTKGANA